MVIQHTPTNPLSTAKIILCNLLFIDYNVQIISTKEMINNMEFFNNNLNYPLSFYYNLMDQSLAGQDMLSEQQDQMIEWETYIHSQIFHGVYYNTCLLKLSNQYKQMALLEKGLKNQATFLNNLNNYLADKLFIIGNKISIVDVSLFSYLSAFDYFFQIRWYQYKHIKKYYTVLKSMKEFFDVLQYSFNFLKPPEHYNKMDF